MPKKVVKLIQRCLNGSRGKVWIGSNISESSLILDGLKQGDGFSTVQFNFTLNYVVGKMSTNELGATFNGSTQIFGYAEDLNLVGNHREVVVKNAEILIKLAEDTGLEVSESKRKYVGDKNRNK